MACSYRITATKLAVLCGIVLMLVSPALTEDKPAGNKKAAAKKADKKGDKEKEEEAAPPLDPWNRPEGSIVEKAARYYLWYDGNGWHLRACSIRLRNFNGTLRITNGKVKSCLPVGLKERTKVKDAWVVNEDRSELKYSFSTSTKSDGLDIKLEGDEAQVEFELLIDAEKSPKWVHIGKDEEHPAKNPFTLPAVPPKPTKEAPKK